MKIFILLLCMGFVLCGPMENNNWENELQPDPTHRLPLETLPTHYNLTLETDLENFNGSLVITIVAQTVTNQVTLHVKDLEIVEVTVTDENSNKIPITKTDFDVDRMFFIITLSENLLKDQTYYLNFLEFRGKLCTDNFGFYLALYEENGETKRIATTQFQTGYARRAYPCYDEPAIKAKYLVSLIRPERYISLSNGKLINSESIGAGKVKDNFAETVLMSSYLTAFIVSEYSYVEKENFRVFARPEYIEKGMADYALNIGYDMIKALEEYLGIKYTWNKMDQIAIPDKYYALGAMENWGLVTYKDSILMHLETSVAEGETTTTIELIAHEFGHQWFGNLVTLKWWKYMWLNEGFATFLQYLGPDMLKPSLKMMDKMVTILQLALSLDSNANTQPLNYETKYPKNGPEAYVSYQKGGSVIRMAQHFLTPDTFQKGLNIYLTAYQFQSTEPDNLFDSWQKAITESYLPEGNTVSTIMTPWVTLAGYPVLNVARNVDTNEIQLSQKRFINPSYELKDDSVWPIPINIAYQNGDFLNTTPQFWLKDHEIRIPDTFDQDAWIIVNKQQTGYYRVNYDLNNWNRIITFLVNKDIDGIHFLNRAQLIDDAFKLAKAGHLYYDVPLRLTEYISKELSNVPLEAYRKNIAYLRTLLIGTKEYKLFKLMLSKQFLLTIDKLSHNGIKDDAKRINAINTSKIAILLCSMKLESCSWNAKRAYYYSLLENNTSISPNLQIPYWCGLMKLKNKNYFNNLLKQLDNANNHQVKLNLIKALGCVEENEEVKSIFNIILKSSSFNRNEKTELLNSLIENNDKGVDNILEFLKKNLSILKHAIHLDRILKRVGNKCVTQHQLEQYENIILDFYGTTHLAESLIANIRDQVLLSEKHLPAIKNWLIAHQDRLTN